MTRMLALGVIALSSLGALRGVAQQTSPIKSASFSQELSAVYGEVDALQTRVDEASFGEDYYDGEAAPSCNCWSEVGCGGWFGGAELVLVKPHTTDELRSDPASNFNFQEADYDFSASPRLYLGFRNCTGRGVRIRYWNFDQNANTTEFSPIFDPGELLGGSLKVTALDVEGSQLVCLGPLQMELSGGVRYGKLEIGSFDTRNGGSTVSEEFEGWGPTIAMDGRLPVGCSQLSLVGNIRSAFIFGDRNELRTSPGRLVVAEHRDTMQNVWESQVGIEYQRCCGCGVLSARTMLEGQYWHNISESQDRDLGFFGVAFRIEYTR